MQTARGTQEKEREFLLVREKERERERERKEIRALFAQRIKNSLWWMYTDSGTTHITTNNTNHT